MDTTNRLALPLIGVLVLGQWFAPVPAAAADAATNPILIDEAVSAGLFGGFIRSAGDVNGDGREDVIVGRHSGDGGGPAPEGSTAAVVVYGSTTLASFSVADMTIADGFRVWPSGALDGSGNQVDGVGDVNGDGYADVLITSSWAAGSGRPIAHVVFGAPGHADVDLASALGGGGVTITAPATLGNVTAAARAGDVNGDGFADFMIAFRESPVDRVAAGSVFLIYGSATKTAVDLSTASRPEVVRIDGQSDYAGLGAALASGDVNGDGRSDLVLRSSQQAGADIGSISVIWGRNSLPDIDLAAPPQGVAVSTSAPRLGAFAEDSPLAVADVNGDGRSDVVVGDPRFAKDSDPYSRQGSVLVMLGGTVFPVAQWRIIGGTYHDQLGGWVAARDLDGDGMAEIASTAYLDVVPGVAYVVRGRKATTTVDLSVASPTVWWKTIAPPAAERAGEGVAIADITGDRVPDLLVSGYGTVVVVPTLDRVGPTSTAPSRALAAGSAISGGRLPIRLSWSATDAQSGVARFELAQSIDDGPWTMVSTTLASPSIYRYLSAGHRHRFRVRAVDRAGNLGAWAYGPTFRLTGISQSSSAVRYAGTWGTSTSTIWWGGTARSSSRAGSTASYSFTGRSIAWVGLKGIGRGKANVYVNGILKATVDLYSATTLKQRVIWAANYSTSATRTITIKVLGTVGRPRFDVDGFVVGS